MKPVSLKPDFQLLPGTTELIENLRASLDFGHTLKTKTLLTRAEHYLKAPVNSGQYDFRYLYDVIETALHLVIEKRAAALRDMDSSEAFEQIERLLSQLPTQRVRTNEQTLYQQFSSPAPLAFVAAYLALDGFINPVLLEPSAGTGALACIARAFGAQVFTNDLSTSRKAFLRFLGFAVHSVDAEQINDLLPLDIVPNVVLMNPPFSATAGRLARNDSSHGARHIQSALSRLAQNGRLVAITGCGLALDRQRASSFWQKIANGYTIKANLSLPSSTFAKFGTAWGTQLIVIEKNGPTPGKDWSQQLTNIRYGAATLLEILTLAKNGALVPTVTQSEAAPPEPPITPNPTVSISASTDSGPIARPEPTTADNETDDSESTSNLFVPYVPAKLRGGRPHPAVIVESASMAAVVPPDITYKPHLASEIISEGLLSNIQLERVIYAGQRHEQRLPDGSRAGFFVGDGTGVGKGRVLAGIIADNWNQDRQRAIWLSVNNDLLESARRDLTDLGLESIALARINDYQPAGEIALPRGVIFSSYSSLIAAAKSGEKRLDQIQRWLGNDGVVIFDEAHKAKNALAGGRGEPTLTGQAVIDLQDPERNTDYRVVYSSATGATDVRNMAYMTRLGLWGIGTSFSGGFQEFMQEIESGGVGAMEMVSRDMKALGMYLSGSISFGVCPQSGKAVEYREIIHRLTPQQREMYNRAADAWQSVLRNIDAALEVTNGGPRARGAALTKFWGDHQRFFRQVICAFKVPAVIAETEAALSDNKSVVISLVGTGEARTRAQVAKATGNGGMLEDLDFSPREVIAAMVDRGFPTTLYQDVTDPGTGKTIQVVVRDKSGNPVQSQEALRMKQQVIDGLSALALPENPLDQLVNHFGELNVAELTGRTRRLIRNSQGRVEYKKRAPEGVAMHRTNVYEMEQYQSGKKRVTIISDAASMGISLHASNRAQNRQRRVHITLELGWSADKQMQTFGRTHRSDQAVPPEYVLLSTELGGEKRFSSTIARRLGSLGALTKGDRSAANSGDLAKYNFETEEGRAALCLMLRTIVQNGNVPGLANPRQTLRNIGLLVINRDGSEEVRKEDLYNVPRFLNRVLALDVEQQNALFDHYLALFDQTVRFAKANGTFDEGVTDIKALAIRISTPPRIVHTDKITNAETTHYTLEVDLPSRAVTFEEADLLRKRKAGAFFRHRKNGHFILALESGRHTNPENGNSYRTYGVWRPEAPRTNYIHEADLADKYRPVSPSKARDWWTQTHAAVPPIETIETHIIGGAIIPLWQRFKTHEEARLRVARVTTDDGQRIVGVRIPPQQVGPIIKALGSFRDLREPHEIFTGILHEGDEVMLVSGLKLCRKTIHREPTIELCGADLHKFAELRILGLINETIDWKQRFFLPTDETEGLQALTDLLARYPLIPNDEANPLNESQAQSVFELPTLSVIDLNAWLTLPTKIDSESRTEAAPPNAFQFPVSDQPLLSQMTLWDSLSEAA
ncbi:MAG: hypothetical protein QOE96_2423 [Blastocatellia bacterium]|jgi:hypothetical protein|nr:hypothetical protein [Blastocatellia bacterium]